MVTDNSQARVASIWFAVFGALLIVGFIVVMLNIAPDIIDGSIWGYSLREWVLRIAMILISLGASIGCLTLSVDIRKKGFPRNLQKERDHV